MMGANTRPRHVRLKRGRIFRKTLIPRLQSNFYKIFFMFHSAMMGTMNDVIGPYRVRMKRERTFRKTLIPHFQNKFYKMMGTMNDAMDPSCLTLKEEINLKTRDGRRLTNCFSLKMTYHGTESNEFQRLPLITQKDICHWKRMLIMTN